MKHFDKVGAQPSALILMAVHFHPESAGAVVRYLIEAVGPPPPKLMEKCASGHPHFVSMFSNQKQPDEEKQARFARYTRICKPVKGANRRGRCHRLESFMSGERQEILLQGVAELKSSFPRYANAATKLDTAIVMGQAAAEAWNTLQEVSGPVTHHLPPPTKKARTSVTSRTQPASSSTRTKRGEAKTDTSMTLPMHRYFPRTKNHGAGKGKEPGQEILPPPSIHVDEYDKYSALAYATSNLPTRVVSLVFFTAVNAEPTIWVVWLRFLGCFKLSEFDIARKLQATGAVTRQYERYSVFEDDFTPELPEQAINLERRGSYMIYKLSSLTEAECSGLATWKAKARASAQQCADIPSDAEPTDNEEGGEDEDAGYSSTGSVEVLNPLFLASLHRRPPAGTSSGVRAGGSRSTVTVNHEDDASSTSSVEFVGSSSQVSAASAVSRKNRRLRGDSSQTLVGSSQSTATVAGKRKREEN
ncbi:hypothetical protein R3P38DRAFT_2811357 [Favolaschia claudopus]|uniref:Uncharacterized protein n=1 Tax=Favolaschia claudopus TaxID=2862362 RepID=A0AAV9Z9W4_9AGAR